MKEVLLFPFHTRKKLAEWLSNLPKTTMLISIRICSWTVESFYLWSISRNDINMNKKLFNNLKSKIPEQCFSKYGHPTSSSSIKYLDAESFWNRNSGVGPSDLCFHKPSRCFWCKLKLNHEARNINHISQTLSGTWLNQEVRANSKGRIGIFWNVSWRCLHSSSSFGELVPHSSVIMQFLVGPLKWDPALWAQNIPDIPTTPFIWF